VSRRANTFPVDDRHIRRALKAANAARKPLALVLAGHNGSGKSTLWYRRLADRLQIPLVNADRLTASILPPANTDTGALPRWARKLRDNDQRWQILAQQGVQAFVGLIMAQKMPFALETVFSHWKQRDDGTYESKADMIRDLQKAGFFVVLLFVGLISAELSILRVKTRQQQGGHAVPVGKLKKRFPRTQAAVRHAAPLADRTLMFDNSQSMAKAFTLVRAQKRTKVLYDCRSDGRVKSVSRIASIWLDRVAPS
jgi:predicted ABC-type ATPase